MAGDAGAKHWPARTALSARWPSRAEMLVALVVNMACGEPKVTKSEQRLDSVLDRRIDVRWQQQPAKLESRGLTLSDLQVLRWRERDRSIQ